MAKELQAALADFSKGSYEVDVQRGCAVLSLKGKGKDADSLTVEIIGDSATVKDVLGK